MRQTYDRRSILGYCTAGAASAAAALLAGAPAAHADTVKFAANLKGADEVPPNQTTGTGTFSATFDTGTKQLTWTGTYTGLTGAVTAAHIHGPADPGKNAAPVFWLSDHDTKTHPFPTPFQGSWTLSDAQASDLMGGRYYVNIHTQANPGGEIRGQLLKA